MLLEAAVVLASWLLLWWLPQVSFEAHWWLWLLPPAAAGLLAERWRGALLGPALGAVGYCAVVALAELSKMARRHWLHMLSREDLGALLLALILSVPVAVLMSVPLAAAAHGLKRLLRRLLG